MFRKTLFAASVGVLISPLSLAAIVDDAVNGGPSTTYFYSTEYLSTASAASTVEAGDLAVIIEAEYAVGDVIDWEVTGGAIESGFPSSVVVPCVDNANAGITFGLLNSDANGARYRVTEIDSATCAAATSTVNALVPFATVAGSGRLVLDAIAVRTAGTITASFSASAGNEDLDTGGGASRNVDLVITGSQFAPTVNQAFNATIDVNKQRTGFEACAAFAVGVVCDDQATWTVDAAAVPDEADFDQNATTPLDNTAQAVTVNADFSWIFDTDDQQAGIQWPGTTVASTCAPTSLTATALTADCTNGLNTLTFDVYQNVVDGELAVLPATSFVSSHVFAYTGIGGNDSSLEVTGINLGSWDLNGFQAKVAYMPFQEGIGQVIYIANRSSQTGEITVDYIGENGESGSFSIGTVAAGSTRAIGPAIRNGLPAALQERGRLALVITANVPACDAQLNAQYNVSGDRAFSVATNNCPVETAIH